jgi:hypothetical protein
MTMTPKALTGPRKKEKAKTDALAALTAEQVKPDQVIPMEEGDFKQF